MDSQSNWVALFSGGKDSSWALHEALSSGVSIVRLLTAQPRGDSYLFHVPATDLAAITAESIGIAHRTFEVTEIDDTAETDASDQGDRELESLEGALSDLDDELPGGVDGIVSGAVESSFQRDRIDRLCERYDLEHHAPLWHCNADEALIEMVEAGFDIRVIAVAADGLDRDWLGRRIDGKSIDELRRLRDRYGIHLMGEGGEYETIVVAAPHMHQRLRFDTETHWDGVRGHLEVRDAWLEPTECSDR